MNIEKPWLENYPKNVPTNISFDEHETLVDLVDHLLKKYSKAEFELMGKTLTYGQIDRMSANLAAYMQSTGLVPGDKVAIMLPNILQYPIALFGLLRAGLIIVNTNPLYTEREMKHQFEDSEVKGVIILENFANKLEKVLPETHIKTVIITSVGELLGFPKGQIVDFVMRKIKRVLPPYNIPNAESFSNVIKKGAKLKLNKTNGCADDVVVHQYTGGTTGVSKGGMLSNMNIISNVYQLKAVSIGRVDESKERVVVALPLYHIFAFTACLLYPMSLGAKIILVPNPRDMKKFVKTFEKSKTTLFMGVNTLFNDLCNDKKFNQIDFSNLKYTVAGGMAVKQYVALKWEEVTGNHICEGYGLTEASPVVCLSPLDREINRIGTVGMPLPNTVVAIVDENGNVVPQGQPGEMIVKGPQVMKGYYNRPNETAKVLKDGWLYTGDIGLMQKDGYFKIVDRKKDMILVSGFNVFPNEIEDVIASHPKVINVAAIGIPDDRTGEQIKVFIEATDKSLTKEEIIKFCKESLTGYKVPKIIEFRDDLPKSNVGKILRRVLKEEELKKKG